MKSINRAVVTKLEIFENELVAIHALEIINNIITGVYFHAYLKKDIRKYNDMYYLSQYQYYGDNYLQNFIDFIGDSKIITYNDEFNRIEKYFKNPVNNEKVEITNLFNQSRKEKKINIIKKSKHGGLIDCTIFARYLFDKYLDKTKIRKMTGIFNKRKYYSKEETQSDNNWDEGDDSSEEENNYDYEEENDNTEIKKDKKNDYDKKETKNVNKLYKGRFVIIDVDTTSFRQKNCRLIAIHAVEVKDGKLTGIFFHSFINKRDYNYDYMYYFAEYNYCLNKKKKLKKFLNFIGNSKIVSHNIPFDLNHLNKELDNCNLNLIKNEKCICTMSIIRKSNCLQNYTLKNCAIFYGILGIRDYHKGIVDATVLAIIVCKMAKNNDKYYNVFNQKEKIYQINEKAKVYTSFFGKKYHLYSSCINLFSERMPMSEAIKKGMKICSKCKRKREYY